MSAVWKFPVPTARRFQIVMPIGAKVLTVQVQNGEPQLWALVDPLAKTWPRTFMVCGTGHGRDDIDDADYVGSFQIDDGSLVFHLFAESLP